MNFALLALTAFLATPSSIVVGTVWYRPRVFGNRWQALTGIDPNTPVNPAVTYGGTFAATAVTAILLAIAAHVAASYFALETLPAALLTALVLWAGLTASRMLVHDLFASKSLRIWLIDAGYELVTLLVMAAIIGLIGA